MVIGEHGSQQREENTGLTSDSYILHCTRCSQKFVAYSSLSLFIRQKVIRIQFRINYVVAYCVHFLRATARSAQRVLAIVILSVRPSVRLFVPVSHPGTDPSPGEIETLGFHDMIAYSL